MRRREMEGRPREAVARTETQVVAAGSGVRRREKERGSGGHLLISYAGAAEAGNHALASAHLADANAALATISTAFGIGRIAVHFTAALSRRLFPSPATPLATNSADHAFLFHHFYVGFRGCDRLHVINFSLMQGLQWPALIQALALRPGGPPFLRITGIGPPSSPGCDELRDVGLRLADLASSVRVRFSFRGVAANSLDEVRLWMLQIAPGEAVAVNSVLQLHRLLVDPADQAPIDTVLECFASVQPKISLDAVSASRAGNAMAEAYLQREICDIVCGEGTARMERHEPLSQWRDRLGRAGLSAVPLGSSALRQERMLVGLFSSEGHCVEEAEGCLTLRWHGRPLFSARFGDLGEKHCSSMTCGIHVSQNHFVLGHVSAMSSKTTPIWAEEGKMNGFDS